MEKFRIVLGVLLLFINAVVFAGGNTIALEYFRIVQTEGKVQIAWRFNELKEVDHFLIQRTNGQISKCFGETKPLKSEISSEFQVEDTLAVPGLNYYRLLWVNIYGDTTVSDWSSVKCIPKIKNSKDIAVKPNPFRDLITISLPIIENSIGQLSVYNEKGIIVFGQRVEEEPRGGLSLNLNLGDLKPGLYMVRFINKESTYQTKILKIN